MESLRGKIWQGIMICELMRAHIHGLPRYSTIIYCLLTVTNIIICMHAFVCM